MPQDDQPKPTRKERQWLMTPPMMRNVLIACAPAVCAGVYFFGWRTLIVLAASTATGVVCEGLFTWPKGKPVNGSVLVSCLLFALILPPTIPIGMAMVGIAFGVVFAKMAFGGFGANVFNPAMSARCFVYLTWPIAMTAGWAEPATTSGPAAGLAKWGVDAVSMATPLDAYKAGEATDYAALFIGNVGGCIGETSALLVMLGAAYMIWKKTASWQIMAACVLGCVVASTALWRVDPSHVGNPIFQLLAGGFAFGTVFMATDPISAARTNPGKWIFGIMVGFLTVILRGYSNFSCGFMFAVLIMNAFNPTIDSLVKDWQQKRKA